MAIILPLKGQSDCTVADRPTYTYRATTAWPCAVRMMCLFEMCLIGLNAVFGWTNFKKDRGCPDATCRLHYKR